MGSNQAVSVIPGLLASRAETAPASLSGQAAVKADPHTQGPLQIKASEYAPGVNLFKVGCSCGRFVGCWQSSPQLAFSSHARHVNGQHVTFGGGR